MDRQRSIARWVGVVFASSILVGCLYSQVKEGLYLRDTLPKEQVRGFAEFRMDPNIRNAPEFAKGGSVWIQWEKIWADSAIKVRAFDLTPSQAVRFATPPGTQPFFIGGAAWGHRNIAIPVREGMVTPVVVRVIGQTSRNTTSSLYQSGTAVSTITTTTGVAYDWVVEWQVEAPRPVEVEP